MAATDTFDHSVAQLSASQRQHLGGYIAQIREQMLASRSEDARLRLLDIFQQEAHDRLEGVSRL